MGGVIMALKVPSKQIGGGDSKEWGVSFKLYINVSICELQLTIRVHTVS